MSKATRWFVWLGVAIIFLVIAVFLIGPALFASIAYPLPENHKAAVAKWSQEYGIDPNLLCALIFTESGWHESSRSGAGAVGLTQIVPGTAAGIAGNLGVSNFSTDQLISDPDNKAIRFGAYYISAVIKRNGGDVRLGLIAYNGGQGAVLAEQRGSPIRGTIAYANKVMAIQSMYGKIYGQWWQSAPDLPQFSVNPKPTDLITSISVLDFWRSIISNSASSPATSTDNSFGNFWQNLVTTPGN